MRRGDIYRVFKPHDDPKRYRCYVVVSRPELIDSARSSVICAPLFTKGRGLSTQIAVGVDEGLKHESWISCDNLRSIEKGKLAGFIGSLSPSKMVELDEALRIALALD
ncbi:MAG: type II toxin-antitoxin system PemK/MazF family toxin [Candidatus Sulfotelmatobacter sp.]